MGKSIRPNFSPDYFVGYFPDTHEFICVMDSTVEGLRDAEQELHTRAQHWLDTQGVVLAEGYTWSYNTQSPNYSATIAMRAPVISAGRLVERYAAILHVEEHGS